MTSLSFDVCAIGNAIVDVIAEGDEAFLRRHSISKGVMTLIDEVRARALYDQMGTAVESSGGSAANTAAGIASFGGKPAFIGKVRNDQLGHIFTHDMKATGVHFATPPLIHGPATARSLIIVTPDAQRSMSTYLGATVELTPGDVDGEVIGAAQVTYLEGYLFDRPAAQAAFALASHKAHEAGRLVALSLSDPFCVERHQKAFRELVQHDVDILFANERELKALYDLPTFEEAFDAARRDCATVIGTRSAKGAVLAQGDHTILVPAQAVQVVDTTGAGDAFAAGVLFGLTHGHSLEVAGRLGALAAAEVISHYGPRPQKSLKTLALDLGLPVEES